ncbi:MAG: hypothetical protein ABSD11_21360 [Methylocella sp.]
MIDGVFEERPGVRIANEKPSILNIDVLVENGLSRGVTMRSPLDGGAQERDLATNYHRCSKAVALEWSRTSALLEKIARSFEDKGRHEDEAAEQREWL